MSLCPRCGQPLGPAAVRHAHQASWTPPAGDVLAILDSLEQAQKDPYERDPVPNGDKNWNGRVYGTDGDGRFVTAAFGREGTSREGHSLIAEGHNSDFSFYDKDSDGVKGHDHLLPDGRKVDRGRYPDA